MDSLWTALRILTCFPTPRAREAAPADLVRSLTWFPLVGAALGAFLGLAEWSVRRVTGSPVASGALVVALSLLATRGVHVRGLMMVAGALFSGRSRENVAELMTRDTPTAFGALLAIAVLLLRYALVLAVPAESRWGALFLAGALSRTAIVWVCWRFRYADVDTGIGSYFSALAGAKDLVWALPLIAAGFGWLGPIAAAAALAGAWLLVHLLALWIAHLLEGLTARAYDAVAEVAELAALGAVAAIALTGRL